jgi:hypothetical protein
MCVLFIYTLSIVPGIDGDLSTKLLKLTNNPPIVVKCLNETPYMLHIVFRQLPPQSEYPLLVFFLVYNLGVYIRVIDRCVVKIL